MTKVRWRVFFVTVFVNKMNTGLCICICDDRLTFWGYKQFPLCCPAQTRRPRCWHLYWKVCVLYLILLPKAVINMQPNGFSWQGLLWLMKSEPQCWKKMVVVSLLHHFEVNTLKLAQKTSGETEACHESCRLVQAAKGLLFRLLL